MPAAQMVGPGPVLTAWRARFAGRRLPMAPPVDPVGPGGPVVELPADWLNRTISGPYVGPLQAQLMLAMGGPAVWMGGVGCVVSGLMLIGAAGKVFVFSSQGSMEMWASITRARAIREVELAESMTQESRAAWLVKKRAALEKAARNRINAAARQTDPDIAGALIADADFALAKWAHYG